MGRGAGDFRRLLEAEIAAAVLPMTVEELRWRLWDRRQPTATKLPKSFHSQVTRELKRHVYQVEKRGLRDFAELSVVYPFKTLDRPVREMRERLLPLLLEMARGRTRYTTAENEQHLLARRRDQWPHFRAAWARVEPPLFAAMALPAARPWALPLLVRGRQLFAERSDVSCTTDLASLVNAAVEQLGHRRLATELKAFVEQVFPAPVRVAKRLSSQLHGLAEFSGSGSSYLKNATSDELLRLDPAYITSLPGHRPRPSGMRGVIEKTRFSSALDRLLMRDALQVYHFIVAVRA